ncbi:aspartate kinase [Flexibacter flexilis DSM 6793]|uniref:Aspartokinase n=1 Tax=Flexibacter flexilis DSM 6793 TaxID=927664 RepID=A0A1I1MR86_9BACT|nr:aspartate kinase [Flexibacter flexilis]SFC87984.1 aspartate kinase [Flexibacter flexilis DSM 6793]
MKIFKFGGASVKDAPAVRNSAKIIKKHAPSNELLVVVSAMGKTTNALEVLYEKAHTKQDYSAEFKQLTQYHEDIVNQLFDNKQAPIFGVLVNMFTRLDAQLEKSPLYKNYDEGYDQIISFGELLSTHIVAHYLTEAGVNNTWLDARRYIQTDDTWREGKVDFAWTEKQVKRELPEILTNKVIVTQGFIGGTLEGKTTTLGREGSDYTASIFAYCLDAESLTIWKDVPGVLNADPRRLAETHLYEQLSYQDAAEMTYYGATVIHPKTIKPLANRNIPLFVRSFIEPDKSGTRISNSRPPKIRPAIIFKPNQKLLSFHIKDLAFITEKNVSTIIEAIGRLNVKANLMQNSATSFSVCVDNDLRRIEKLRNLLSEEFSIYYNENLQLITIKNYDEASVQEITQGKEILLEQRTRHTFQIVVKE